MRCALEIDHEEFTLDVGGEFSWGEDEILFNVDGSDSIIRNVPWKTEGQRHRSSDMMLSLLVAVCSDCCMRSGTRSLRHQPRNNSARDCECSQDNSGS